MKYFGRVWAGLQWDDHYGTNERVYLATNPLFDVSIWNQHTNIINGERLTNNVVEGWHKGFNDFVSIPHPPLQRFLYATLLHQNNKECDINRQKMGQLNSPSVNRRMHSIQKAVLTYANEEEDGKDIFFFLDTVSTLCEEDRQIRKMTVKKAHKVTKAKKVPRN